jgi:hypothetical protein
VSTIASNPRISANKLGEFLTTQSPVRRRGIIRDQKHPSSVVVPRYRQATDPIEAFLASGGVDVAGMVAKIDALRAATGGSDWHADDNKNTADALEKFLEIFELLPADGFTYIRGANEVPRLIIAGVSISVRPDFLIHFQRRGKDSVGSLKIHYIRGDERALRPAGQE